ncbi:hypothetical protein POJ06DRAFT_235423 [Lipomyces tetrasporus]|uniref:Uncharacterized protein n=1 Tax=Lipomyces tetrasporus TaxID=54092 RepID=A0AAD7QVU8_9ASCO|nr:uncharacterized protein POJ06DRAFT_235423 [Lipomyces tetrasporus]KAJ8102455.1 hypothetical protein POJ06DRAFT_235423 [Lipomyces tetrasporus]
MYSLKQPRPAPASISYDAGRPNAATPAARFPLHVWGQQAVNAFERVLGPSNNMATWTHLPPPAELEAALDEIRDVEPLNLVLELYERQVARTAILMSLNAQLEHEVAELQQQLHRQAVFLQSPPQAAHFQLYPHQPDFIDPQLGTPPERPRYNARKNGVIVGVAPPYNGYPAKVPLTAYQNGYAAYYSQFRAQQYAPYNGPPPDTGDGRPEATPSHPSQSPTQRRADGSERTESEPSAADDDKILHASAGDEESRGEKRTLDQTESGPNGATESDIIIEEPAQQDHPKKRGRPRKRL